MKRLALILLAAAIPILAVPAARAEEGIEGDIAVGAHSVSTEDAQSKAGKYYPLSSSFALFSWWNFDISEHDQIRLDLRFLDEDDQKHRIWGSFSPALTFSASMNKFVHNLNHDPLKNLAATDEAGKIIYATDLDPKARYGIVYEEDKAHLTYRPTGARPFSISGGAQVLKREGHQQNLSTSHCFSCHTIGQTQGVDEDLTVFAGRIGYETPNWGVSLAATTQEFDDAADEISIFYEDALQPVFKTPVFYNRVQYRNGVFPVGITTTWQRNTQLLQGYWHGASAHLDATVAAAQTEADRNKEADFQGGLNPGLSSDYLSARLRFLYDFGRATSLKLIGRYEKVDSDDVFVDVNEPTGVAPAFNNGRTYSDLYGPNGSFRQGDWDGAYDFTPWVADYTRRSAASRKVISGRADVLFRFGEGYRQRLKVALTGRDIDRESYEVTDDGDTQTTEYTLKGAYYGRTDKLRYQVAAEYYQADHAFNYVDGGCLEAGFDPTLVNGAYPTPGAPWVSLQYFELHQLRFANLSNRPTDGLSLNGQVNFLPSENLSVNVNAKWLDQKNDETQVSDWAREYLDLGATIWWAPSARFYLVGSVNWMQDDQETHVCVPLMDG